MLQGNTKALFRKSVVYIVEINRKVYFSSAIFIGKVYFYLVIS